MKKTLISLIFLLSFVSLKAQFPKPTGAVSIPTYQMYRTPADSGITIYQGSVNLYNSFLMKWDSVKLKSYATNYKLRLYRLINDTIRLKGTATVFDLLSYKLKDDSLKYYLYKPGKTGGQTAIGGTAVTDILKLQGTAGNGTLTSPAVQVLVGNNGGTIAETTLNNGNKGLGTTSPASKLDIYKASSNGGDMLRLIAGGGYPGTFVYNYSNTSYEQDYNIFYRARGTVASPLAVQSGDGLGIYSFRGHDGTSFANYDGASINAKAGSDYTVSSHETYLSLYTTPVNTVNAVERLRILGKGNIGIKGITAPTAGFHIGAGTATAGTAPLKFTSGTLNTTAEVGAVEFLTDKFYGTITTNAARKQFAFTNDSSKYYEKLTNKVTSISSGSTDIEYPSAKLLYDQLGLVWATAATPRELDYMEYSTDNAAQAAYVANTSAAYVSQYPSQDADHVKATSSETSNNYLPYFATDPTKSLTGAPLGASWLSNAASVNQRFHIDLGSSKTVTKIYYENMHNAGIITTWGVKNFTFWGSNTAGDFADLTYATDGTWVQIGGALQMDEHSEADAADPKFIVVTNTTAYRYYAFKFADNWGNATYMAVRRIELQILIPAAFQSYSGSEHYQGNYSLKGIAAITTSDDKTLTRTISPSINLTRQTTIKFHIYSSRVGANIKVGIYDATAPTTTEKTYTVLAANTWEECTWDISAVANADKDAISKIIITIVNADAENTFYIDNMYSPIPFEYPDLSGYSLTNHNHLNIYEPVLGNPGVDDYVLSSKIDGTRSWVAAGIGSGTVTSIATGLGLTGGTITTTGTLSIDTTSASILSRQRALHEYLTKSHAALTTTAHGLGASAFHADNFFEAPLTFSTGLNRVGNIITSTITSNQIFISTWNATTNDPFLEDGVGTSGYYHYVTTAGTQTFGGVSIDFVVGSSIIYNGSVWQLIPITAGTFPGFGTSHSLAAYGDHLHTGVYQPAGSYVTGTPWTGMGYLTEETDPTIYAWAKAATKPSYTYAEVGALAYRTFGSAADYAYSAFLPFRTFGSVVDYDYSTFEPSLGNPPVDGYISSSLIDGTRTWIAPGAGGGMVYPGVGIALSTGSSWGASITDNSSNWNTAHADRLKWDGGATGLTAATGRASLGLPVTSVQALSGTSVAWNVANGINATLTLTDNTTITLSNLVAGTSGNITITNPAGAAKTLTLAGYTNKISPVVYSAANMLICSGASKIDVFSWWYDGTRLFWNGTNDYN